MNTRRIAFVLAAATAGMLGVAGAAWACVPGHDHAGSAEAKGHSVDPALAPSLPVPTALPVAAATAEAPDAFDTASATNAAAEDGSSKGAVGYVVLALGVAMVLAGAVTGLRRSRGAAARRPVVD